MADVDFDDFDAGYGAPMTRQVRLARIVTLGGAAASGALVLGLGIWGYNIAVRDVQGIPVIRAMEGPMRITPENPGGEVADHQGLSVNTVAALGVAAPPPEKLILAPRPMELTEEDQPGLAGGPAVAADAARAPLAAPPADAVAVLSVAAPEALLPQDAATVSAPPPVAAAAPATTPDPQQDAVELALAEALTDATLTDGAQTDTPLTEAAVPATETAALATEATPRPRARPGEAAAPPAAAPASEIDPLTLAAGTRLVQLGAFDTPDEARAEWTRLVNANSDLLAGKSLVVQAATSGGRAFFRLRAAGFTSEDEARTLCSALLERDATCIPVLHG